MTKKGAPTVVRVQCWEDIIMRGKREVVMWNKPFRLVKVEIFKPDGELMFTRPLWLLVSGEKRLELTLEEIYDIYRQRFDLEHFFRFGKNRLLMDKCQSPDVNHEEAWWQIVLIAYAQLYLARKIAKSMPQPWERTSPRYKESNTEKTPTQVQRDFGRIIGVIGTPANPPKPRKKALGRQNGDLQTKRKRHPVIKKASKRQKKKQI